MKELKYQYVQVYFIKSLWDSPIQESIEIVSECNFQAVITANPDAYRLDLERRMAAEETFLCRLDYRYQEGDTFESVFERHLKKIEGTCKQQRTNGSYLVLIWIETIFIEDINPALYREFENFSTCLDLSDYMFRLDSRTVTMLESKLSLVLSALLLTIDIKLDEQNQLNIEKLCSGAICYSESGKPIYSNLLLKLISIVCTP